MQVFCSICHCLLLNSLHANCMSSLYFCTEKMYSINCLNHSTLKFSGFLWCWCSSCFFSDYFWVLGWYCVLVLEQINYLSVQLLIIFREEFKRCMKQWSFQIPITTVLGAGLCSSSPGILFESGSKILSLESSKEGVTALWASYQAQAKVSRWMKAESKN